MTRHPRARPPDGRRPDGRARSRRGDARADIVVVDDLWPVLLRLDDDAEPPAARRRRRPRPAPELVVGLLSFAVLTAGVVAAAAGAE